MSSDEYRYFTDRLLVNEWHSLHKSEWKQPELDNVVIDILTPSVTRALPQDWQGAYSVERAKRWIEERDKESTALIILELATRVPIGFVILTGDKDLRLGYLLKESAWGKGYASELVQGLVKWSKRHFIRSITGGVEKGNIASARVLEKNGFMLHSDTNSGEELIFLWKTTD